MVRVTFFALAGCWQAGSALHFGVTAAFADIVELATSKLASCRTGLTYIWMLVLEACLE